MRAGTLNIGTEENPFDKKAIIELLGDNTQHYWSFTSAVEAGNKNLVITGNVNMYGKKPDHYTSRLLKSAYKGYGQDDKKIKVESNLGW